MKPFIALGFCLLALSTAYAQKTTTTKTTTTTTTKTVHTTTTAHGSAIGGTIRDARNHPLAGIEAFIYEADSSIIASGYTDAMGFYETNGVLPGKYDLKIVYASSKAIIVKGVPVKGGVTQVNLSANPPDADTTMLYTDIAPKPLEKKKAKKA